MSLLPEYVVPYMIHLLAHDPDFTKPQEYDQLKDIKESVLADSLVYCDDLHKTKKNGKWLVRQQLKVCVLVCVGASGLCWKC